MIKKIKQLEKKALSPEDIRNISGKDFRMILYSDIHNYKNIEDLFNGSQFIVILYEYKPQFGHYVLLFKYDNNKVVEYFDSIYKYPDFVLTKLPERVKYQLNENKNYLVNLLVKAKYKIEYNDIKMQKDNTATCGRWCGLRIRYSDIKLDDFINIFIKKYLDPDEICTYISYKISGI